MSASDAAIAALRSGSSSSSACVLDTPLGAARFDWGCSRACETNPAPLWPFASSKLISSARFKSASKLSSTRGFRGSMDPWYKVRLGFEASNPFGTGIPRDLSVNF